MVIFGEMEMSIDARYATKWETSNPLYIVLKESMSIFHEKRGLEVFLSLFPDSYSNELLERNSKHYNLENLYENIKNHFIAFYDYDPQSELISKYNRILNSMFDGRDTNKRYIYVDELLQLSINLFIATLLKWYDEKHNNEIYGECFLNTLYLMNNVCIFGDAPSEDGVRWLMEPFKGDPHIISISEDCFWTIMAFTFAHELAHEYIASKKTNRKETKIQGKKKTIDRAKIREEFEADKIAYDIVLRIIMEGDDNEFVLKRYTYLSPMMYMDFFDLFYYTDRVLYKKNVVLSDHPTPKDRKSSLFGIVDNDIYQFDTEEGNNLYNCFLDAFDLYKEELLLKEQKGKLKTVTYTLRRNQLEEKYDS